MYYEKYYALLILTKKFVELKLFLPKYKAVGASIAYF